MTGCIGETDCPAYPEKYLTWFPYHENEKLTFTNGVDTAVFLILETKKSGSFSFKNNCKCDCAADAYAITAVDPVLNLKITASGNYYSDFVSYAYTFTEYGYSGIYYGAQRDDVFDFRNENNKLSVEIIPEFDNGMHQYSKVVKLENDTTDNRCHVWQIWVADSIGLIQFSDRLENKTWKLVQ